MFASKVGNAQTKATASSTKSLAHQRSMFVARPFGDSAAEQAHIPQQSIGNQAPLRLRTQQGFSTTTIKVGGDREEGADGASSTAQAATRGLSWDFSRIPIFPPERPNQVQSSFAQPVQPGIIQRKLVVGQVNDPLEHEADRVADQVMRMPDSSLSVTCAPPPISRKCAQCEAEEEDKTQTLQTKPASAASVSRDAPRIVQEVLRKPGQPLDAKTQAFFEPRFGRDFSRVRLHTDAEAAASARALNALAYTVDSEVVFNTGRHDPATESGRHLLAHELTHVLQRSGGAATLRRTGDPSKAPKVLSCQIASDIASATDVLLFDNDVSTLAVEQKARLDALAASWHGRGDAATVRIDGFASEIGTEEYNWGLSCARAVAVQQELLSPSDPGVTGMPQASLDIFMQGETSEFGDEAQNRRVQLFLPNAAPAQNAPSPQQPDDATKSIPAPAPAAKTSDCDTTQTGLIAAAIGNAQSNIAAVLPPLSANPVTADMQNALWIYFRDSSSGTAARVATNLGKIAAKLSSITYECENDCKDDANGVELGYTRIGTMVTGIGDIHLCMNNLKPNADDIANTIIHEAAHFVLFATDSGGYYSTDCSETESTAAAGTGTKLDTTDSYSCFVKNWLTQTAADRADTKGDLTGANIAGIQQAPPGPIDLSGPPKRPIFAMHLTRGPLAFIPGVSYRWVFRDDQDRSYVMTDTDGKSLFEFKQATESVLAIFNQPTRDLLKQRGITSGKVVCRATSPVFGDTRFEVPVTFGPLTSPPTPVPPP
jgi:outer membrane protein OmpA-like peptidoglycan-associated protein